MEQLELALDRGCGTCVNDYAPRPRHDGVGCYHCYFRPFDDERDRWGYMNWEGKTDESDI